MPHTPTSRRAEPTQRAGRPSVRAAVRAFGDAWMVAFIDDDGECPPMRAAVRDESVMRMQYRERERARFEKQHREREQARAAQPA